MYFSLCFVCPARFCEITGDEDSSTAFLKNFVSQAVANLPMLVTVDNVLLDYSKKEHMYHVRVLVHYFMIFENDVNKVEAVNLQIEEYTSRALLQCFWEVNAFGC